MALTREYQATVDLSEDGLVTPFTAAITERCPGASFSTTNGGRRLYIRIQLEPRRYSDVSYMVRQAMLVLEIELKCFFCREEHVLLEDGVRKYT